MQSGAANRQLTITISTLHKSINCAPGAVIPTRPAAEPPQQTQQLYQFLQQLLAAALTPGQKLITDPNFAAV